MFLLSISFGLPVALGAGGGGTGGVGGRCGVVVVAVLTGGGAWLELGAPALAAAAAAAIPFSSATTELGMASPEGSRIDLPAPSFVSSRTYTFFCIQRETG